MPPHEEPPVQLPAGASEESRLRLDLARRLLASCPPEMGVEIAITGSVSRGIADADSDIELNLWVDALPNIEQRARWLESAGCTDNTGASHIDPDGFTWNTCRLDEIWLEIGWAELAPWEELVRQIAAGSHDAHATLRQAWMLQHAVPLRTAGHLSRWQALLSTYPPDLAARIIRDNTEVWSDPHVPGVRFGLARRGQLYALAARLHWDVQNLLRVLWTINQRWDQDWKWIDERTLDLPLTPHRLAPRINALFNLSDPMRSARDCMELILEVLALVPKEHDVSAATRSVRNTLDAEVRGKPVIRVCAAIIRGDTIAMVRVDHGSHTHWTLPGGAVEPGETPEDAVLREVREETSLVCRQPVPLFDRVWSTAGIERCFLLDAPSGAPLELGSDPELAEARQQLTAVAWRPMAGEHDDVHVARVAEALEESSN